MRITLLKSKIHRATVTDSRLDYTGSITIDQNLMDIAGIVPYEKVLVANLTNGTRHETYVVKGERGSGTIMVMGAAAHLVNVGDQVIIMDFADYDPAEVADHKPVIVIVDERNQPIR
jgi:aspartate 1-decarboxylase